MKLNAKIFLKVLLLIIVSALAITCTLQHSWIAVFKFLLFLNILFIFTYIAFTFLFYGLMKFMVKFGLDKHGMAKEILDNLPPTASGFILEQLNDINGIIKLYIQYIIK